MSGEGRNVADQVFREAEIQKWTAIEEVSRLFEKKSRDWADIQFAKSLLQISTAAKSIMPYLSDYDQERPSANIDKDRAWAEYRAMNTGGDKGTGGWEVGVVDKEDDVASLKEKFETKWIEDKVKRERMAGMRVSQAKRARNDYQREDQMRAVARGKLREAKQAD